MKILYGVTGEGLGHTMRARALAQHLAARGHRVKLAASGRAVAILRDHGLDTIAIDGLQLHYADGEVRRARSLAVNARRGAAALARNVEITLTDVLDFDPDAVITDFDSFAWVAGRLLGRPIVSFDHQHVIDRFRHRKEVTDRLSSGLRAVRAFVSAKTPSCAHYVVTSFFFPPVRQSKATSTTLVGPVVRPEIAEARPRRGEHVIVYQTTGGDPRLLPTLTALRDVPFMVYGLGREERRGNVTLRRFDEGRFVDELASARAVVANGGFTAIAEAITLGKPVLSVPLRRQTEQELNAAYLEELGFGVSARWLEPGILRRFLDRTDDFGQVQDARLFTGTADACLAVESALARATAEAA